MQRKYLFIVLQIIFALLGIISALAVALGIQWFLGGSQMYKTPFTDGEDWRPIFGGAFAIAGGLLILFGSLFTILFITLFKLIGKRSNQKQAKATVIKPRS